MSITPIFKGAGSKSDPSNYRPISITSTISQIFESAIKVQIMQYFQDHSIITPHQSAYLHGRSTQTALHSVIDTLSSNMNDGSLSAVCALDMAKGFDTIPHRLLLHKLCYYGFDHLAVTWFKSYLSRRTQIVKGFNTVSSPLRISIRAPQGSILGPLLFILYINDLPSIFTDCHCQIYADDTTLYCNASTLDDVQEILQNNLYLCEKWFQANQLTVNSQKSSIILFGKRNNSSFSVKLNNVELPVSSEIKLLGVTIDDQLTWKSHIQYLCSKISPKLGLLHRLSRCVPLDYLGYIYNALIQSLFDYGITIWGSCCKTYLQKLQRLQNRCARIVTGIHDYSVPSASLIHSLKWFNMHQRYEYFVAIFMFKCYNNLLPSRNVNMFKLVNSVHQYPTRSANNDDFVLPFPRTEHFKHSILFTGPVVWNKIPKTIKDCIDIYSFKAYYKRHLFARDFN